MENMMGKVDCFMIALSASKQTGTKEKARALKSRGQQPGIDVNHRFY
jgi:hypothetical protein